MPHKRSDGTTETHLVWVPIDFTVKRKTKDGVKVLTLPVKTQPIGNFEALYLNERALNAYANGKNVFITEGMMDFVKTDAELQFVIAHELAHNIGKHLEKRKTTPSLVLFLVVSWGALQAALRERITQI